jgi:hypothetical protein
MPKRFVLGGVSLGGGIVPGIAVARAKGGQASPKVSAALNNSRLHQFARRNLKFFVGICPLELAPSAKGLTMLNDSIFISLLVEIREKFRAPRTRYFSDR